MVQLRDSVKAVIYFIFPKMEGNLLNIWAIIGFWKILLHEINLLVTGIVQL